jgi:hypothetical protein
MVASGAAMAQTATHNDAVGMLDAEKVPGTLIGIQYEHWFFGPQSWKTTEAIPLMGKYTTDEPTVAKHYAQFHELGIDWLLIDWSNMLWMREAWNAQDEWNPQAGETGRLVDKTAVLFKTALDLHRQGKYAPKLVFLLGLQNGPPVAHKMDRFNAILAWLKTNYLNKPEYKDLWLYYGGKPLVTILYVPPDPCTQLPQDLAGSQLHGEDWTIRWTGAELQKTHGERCGMWSWMDGVIPQIVTMRDGMAEETVVTPSSFVLPGNGWTAPTAIARDHGVPYVESWKAALAVRPKFIQVHQWNEFAGQQKGKGFAASYWDPQAVAAAQKGGSDIYYDEYDVQRSDDIEPTELHGCGYRGCGGWGYYYYNLTRAMISLYRGKTPDITVLALSEPEGKVETSAGPVELHWAWAGKAPESFSIALDGKEVASGLEGTSYRLNLSGLKAGTHRVVLRAAGVSTRFSLDAARPAKESAKPLPVEAEVSFETVAGAAN